MAKKLIFAVAFLGMLAQFAFGQGAGQIVGSVRDQSQGSVPGVTVIRPLSGPPGAIS